MISLKKPVTLVSIDLWGTLVGADSSLPAMMAEFIATRSSLSIREAADEMYTLGRALDSEAFRTGIDIPSCDKLTALLRACDIADMTGVELEEVVAEHVSAAPLVLLEPDCIGALNSLEARGAQVVYASNSGFVGASIMRSELLRLRLLTPAGTRRCVFSDEVGVAKPSTQYFDLVRQGHSRGEVIHIGDNLIADVHGPTAAGIGSVLINRSELLVAQGDVQVARSVTAVLEAL